MAARKTKSDNSAMNVIRSDIESGSFKRIYLLFGEERYLVAQYRQALTDHIIQDGDTMNLNIHDSGSLSLNELMDQALTMPFFASYRLVVAVDTGLFAPNAKKPGGKKTDGEETETLIKFMEQIPETTVLLFVESSVDKRSRMYKAAVKYGLAAEFAHPDFAALSRWVLSKLSKEDIRITKTALEHFLEMTGDDMTRISSELEKLIAFAGEGGAVRIDDVDELVSVRLENRIFDMVDAIARKDSRKALALYDDLLALKEEPMRILALIARQFNMLYQVSELMEEGRSMPLMEDALDMKGRGWLIRRYIEQARAFSKEQLRIRVEDCVRTEERIKTGYIDMRLGVEMCIVRCM